MKSQAFRRFQSACAWALFSILLGNGALGVSARQTGQKIEPPAATREQAAPIPLELGKPVEREIKGGEKHIYTLNLQAGEFAEIEVEQKGIDVVVTVFEPDGKRYMEFNSEQQTSEGESVEVVAESTGTYRFEVQPADKEAKSGNYLAKITQRRPADQKDRDRTAGNKEYADSVLLSNQGTKEGREAAIKKLENALLLYRKAEEKRSEALILNTTGSIHQDLGDNRKALDYFLQALSLCQIIGDKQKEAHTLSNIGLIYSTLGENQKALNCYLQSLALQRDVKNKKGESAVLHNIASMYSDLGENQKALDYYKQALVLRQEIDDRQGEAFTLNDIGSVHKDLGELQKSLDFYNQALPLHRAVKNQEGEAQTLMNIGTVFQSLGEQKKALDYFTQVLPIFKKTGLKQGEAFTLTNIGNAFQRLGEQTKALNSYSQALELFQTIDERRGETSTLINIGSVYTDIGENQKAFNFYAQALLLSRMTKNRPLEAVTLNNIGSVYRVLGEYGKAQDYYSSALLLYRASGDRRGEAVALNNIAVAYKSVREFDKAISYLEQSLPIRRAVKDRAGEASTFLNIGLIYQDLGNQQKALDSYLQALSLFRAVKGSRGEARTLAGASITYLSLGEFSKALDSCIQALSLCRQVEDKDGEAKTLSIWSKLERDQSNLPAARAKIEEAIALVESLRSNVASQELRASYFATVRGYYTLWLDILMRMHEKDPTAGHAAEAFTIAERGRARGLLELLTEARADIRQGVDPALLESEKSLQRRITAKADILIRLKATSGKEQQAAEMEKEITALTTELEQVRADIRVKSPRYAALTQPEPLGLAEIQAQVLDSETTLLEYALGEERSYLWVVTKTGMTVHALPKGKEIEDQARKVYELLTRRTRSAFAKLDARVAAQAESEYAEASAALSRMILAPVADKLDTKRLLVVADGALQYVPFAALPLPRTEKQDSSSTQNSASSLVTHHSSLLIERFEIVSAPSATTAALQRRDLKDRKPAERLVAVIADPVFDKRDPRVKPLPETKPAEPPAQPAAPAGDTEKPSDAVLPLTEDDIRDIGLGSEAKLKQSAKETSVADDTLTIPRLKFAETEANNILALVPPKLARKAVSFDASRATATAPELAEYQIVHFATHGFLNGEHPELSGLVLSLVDERGHPQDGFLRAMDVFNLNLPAETVVLSACRTGLGKEIKGEGLMGLSRGFLYAGAKRLVVSLWNVNDRATSELMTRFYRKVLKDKQRPAAALRAAQLELMRGKQWKSPFYWAPFVVQGEWN